MIGKLDNLMQFNSEALRLRAQRQEMLASNLANSDTPNYKAVDFKFADALRQASGMQGSTQVSTLPQTAIARTAAGHMNAGGASSFNASLSTQVLYRTPTQAAVD